MRFGSPPTIASALTRVVLLAGCGAIGVACGDNGTGPTPISSISFLSAPASGSTIVASACPGPPICFFPRGSDAFPVTLAITSGRDLPFARLNVYLVTAPADQCPPGIRNSCYCGQNLPDWPHWRPFPRGQTVTYTVTGFEFPTPCDVIGIRAVLDTRDGGPYFPPPPSELEADATLQATYRLTR